MQLYLLPSARGDEQIEIKNIVRVQAISNYTKIFFNASMHGKKTLILCKGLKWMEDKLPKQQFIAYIVPIL